MLIIYVTCIHWTLQLVRNKHRHFLWHECAELGKKTAIHIDCVWMFDRKVNVSVCACQKYSMSTPYLPLPARLYCHLFRQRFSAFLPPPLKRLAFMMRIMRAKTKYVSIERFLIFWKDVGVPSWSTTLSSAFCSSASFSLVRTGSWPPTTPRSSICTNTSLGGWGRGTAMIGGGLCGGTSLPSSKLENLYQGCCFKFCKNSVLN